MSDALSQVSGKSRATNRNAEKICAYCGKIERDHFARHYDRQHGIKLKEERFEWDKNKPEVPLLGEPHCINWKEVIFNNEAPIGIRGSFKPSTTADKSLPAFSQFGDGVPMNYVNEEEKIRTDAVPQFGGLEQTAQNSKNTSPRSLLRKRSPPKPQGELDYEQMVRQESQPMAKLSAQSLKGLGTVPVTQKVAPSQELEFAMPDPLSHTVYRDQGMRDQEAIQQLKAIEAKKDGIVDVQAVQLIKIAACLGQPLVSSYIELSKEHLTHVKDLLSFTQTQVKTLSEEQITAIAFVSVLFGGSCWNSLPKMLSRLDEGKLKDVLLSLCPHLATKFGDNLAKWVCGSWKYLEEQTLTLLRFLKELNLENTLSSNIVTLSTMVKVTDPSDYCTLAEGFSNYPAFEIVLDSISAFAPTWKSEQKFEFDAFCLLTRFLNADENHELIMANQAELAELPLSSWLDNLKVWQASSKVCDVESVQFRLDQLQGQYGPLLKVHVNDLLCSADKRYFRTFHQVNSSPNALQFANAQYSAFSLNTYPKQMWCIPSGWGKSRVLSAIGLILLLSGSTNKVHMVFDSDHLMKRDQKEFRAWWLQHDLESSVEYHIGLDFECQSREVILIDEADEFILSDPTGFQLKTQVNKCICLTATPDNDDKKGAEREVLKMLGFSSFNGQPTMPVGSQTVTSVSDLKVNETLPFDSDSPELISFIQKELKERAVLLYCSPEFPQLLIDAAVSFVLMKDGETINDEFLRTLDNCNDPEGTHALIVAPGPFGM